MDILNATTIRAPIKQQQQSINIVSNLIDSFEIANSTNSSSSSTASFNSTPSPSSIDNNNSSTATGGFASDIASSIGVGAASGDQLGIGAFNSNNNSSSSILLQYSNLLNQQQQGALLSPNNDLLVSSSSVSSVSNQLQHPQQSAFASFQPTSATATMFGNNGFMNTHDHFVSPLKQQAQQQQNLNENPTYLNLLNNSPNIGGNGNRLHGYTLTNSNNNQNKNTYNRGGNSNNNNNNNKKLSSAGNSLNSSQQQQQQNTKQQPQGIYGGGYGGNSGKNILVNGSMQSLSPQQQQMKQNKNNNGGGNKNGYQQQQQQQQFHNNNTNFNNKLNMKLNSPVVGGGASSGSADSFGSYQPSLSPSSILAAAAVATANSNNNLNSFFLSNGGETLENGQFHRNGANNQQQLLHQQHHQVNNWLTNSNTNSASSSMNVNNSGSMMCDELTMSMSNMFRNSENPINSSSPSSSSSFGLNFVSNKATTTNHNNEINNNSKFLNQQNTGLIRSNTMAIDENGSKQMSMVVVPPSAAVNNSRDLNDFKSPHHLNHNNTTASVLSNSLPTSTIDMNFFGDIWLNSSVTNELNATFGTNSIGHNSNNINNANNAMSSNVSSVSNSANVVGSSAIFNNNNNTSEQQHHHNHHLLNQGGQASANKLFDLWQPISSSTNGPNGTNGGSNGFGSNLSWPDHFSGFSSSTSTVNHPDSLNGAASAMMAAVGNVADITNSKATNDLFELNKKADIFLNKQDGQMNDYFNLFELFKKMFVEHTVSNDFELCQTNFDFYSRLVKSDLDRFDFSHEHRKQLATIDSEFVESMLKLDDDKRLIGRELNEFQTYFKTLYGSSTTAIINNGGYCPIGGDSGSSSRDHLFLSLSNKIKQMPFFNNLYSAKYNHQFLNLAQFYKKIIDTIPRELLIHLPIIAELSNRFACETFEDNNGQNNNNNGGTTTTTTTRDTSDCVSNNEPLFNAYRNLILELDKLKFQQQRQENQNNDNENNINNKQQSADVLRNNNKQADSNELFDSSGNSLIDKENKNPSKDLLTKKSATTKNQPKKKSSGSSLTVHHNVVQVKQDNLVHLPSYFPVAFDVLNLNGPISLIYNRVKPTKLQASMSPNRQTLDSIDGELSKALPGSIVFEKTNFIGGGSGTGGSTNKSFHKLVTRLAKYFPNLSSKQLTELTIQSKYAIMKKHKHQYGFSGYKISELVKYISDFICENSIMSTSNNVPVSEFRSSQSQSHHHQSSLSSSAVAKGVSWSMVAALNNQQQQQQQSTVSNGSNPGCQSPHQQQQSSQQSPILTPNNSNNTNNLIKLEKNTSTSNSGGNSGNNSSNLILSSNGRIIGDLSILANKLNLQHHSHHTNNNNIQNNLNNIILNSSSSSASSITNLLNSNINNSSSTTANTSNTTTAICAFCKNVIGGGGGGGGSTGNNLDINNDKNVKIQIISCHHIFHKECLDYWTQKSNHCPQCEQYILRNDEFPSL